jgi:hypothetical protein
MTAFDSEVRDGVDGFIADLRDFGIEATLEAGVVTYEVEAIAGARAGQRVRTGVGVDELQSWPAASPHWLHFPVEVLFPAMNVDAGATLPGWVRHSWDNSFWTMTVHPAQAWLAWIRAVIGKATA